MTKKTFPVTVTRLPVVRCDLCGRALAPGRDGAGAVLTRHYEKHHRAAVTGRPDPAAGEDDES